MKANKRPCRIQRIRRLNRAGISRCVRTAAVRKNTSTPFKAAALVDACKFAVNLLIKSHLNVFELAGYFLTFKLRCKAAFIAQHAASLLALRDVARGALKPLAVAALIAAELRHVLEARPFSLVEAAAKLAKARLFARSRCLQSARLAVALASILAEFSTHRFTAAHLLLLAMNSYQKEQQTKKNANETFHSMKDD